VTDGICSSVDHQKRFSAALGKELTIRASISRPTDDCPGDRGISSSGIRIKLIASYFPAQKAVFGRPRNEFGRADPAGYKL
jgi:hypothetical protein